MAYTIENILQQVYDKGRTDCMRDTPQAHNAITRYVKNQGLLIRRLVAKQAKIIFEEEAVENDN